MVIHLQVIGNPSIPLIYLNSMDLLMITCSLADSREPDFRHQPFMTGTECTKVQKGGCRDLRIAAEFASQKEPSGYVEVATEAMAIDLYINIYMCVYIYIY